MAHAMTHKDNSSARDLSGKEVEQNVIRIENQIERATHSLFQQKAVLEKIIKECCEIGFGFASIQLVRPEEQIIEAVTGAAWAGKAGHFLEPVNNLRDIQADICQTCRTEVIAGWDDRFDEWVYKKYKHQDSIRIFTPLILVQDDKGCNDQKWFNNFDQKWITHKVNESWFKGGEQNQPKENGQHSVVEVLLPKSYIGNEIKVIGTIEVGYWSFDSPLALIEKDKVIDLIVKAGEWALKIRETQLPCVLDEITKIAMREVKADGATLHFLEGLPPKSNILEIGTDGSIKKKYLEMKTGRIPYTYEVFSELIGREFIRECPPCIGGEGQLAIAANQERILPSSSQSLKEYNQKEFDLGIREIVIFPLIVDQYKGCLYLHFKQENPFNKEAISWLRLFRNRIEEAIRYGITYEHQRESYNQLIVLHSVAQSLTRDLDQEDLLHQIAWSTLNVLAADNVTIYRYIQAQNQFTYPPTSAGRLKSKEQEKAKIDSDDVPAKLVKKGKNVYCPSLDYQEVFDDSLFAKEEGIQVAAGILLKVNEQIVGTLLINYRRPHVFRDDEIKIIETLATSAAITIANQEGLKKLQQGLEILSDITAHQVENIETTVNLDIESLLRLIMDGFVKYTGANLADIRLFNPESQKLKMEVWYPPDASGASSIHTTLGEGITGWVAKTKKEYYSPDVTIDKHYKAYFEEGVGSELCYPLLDQEDRLVGIINLESYQKGSFDAFYEIPRPKKMLEALVDHAVIAIQAMKNRDKLIKMKALADW
jgi:GAF domain-containing protein